jgi:uncharacterized protein
MHMRQTVALGVFLAAYGNLAALVVGSATPTDQWPGVVLGVLLLGLVLAWARFSERLSAAELGLRRKGLVRSAGLGLLLALATALPGLLFLRFPPLLGQAVEYSPLTSVSREALLWRALVWMPLDTVVPEEFAFRCVLLATLRRRLGVVPAVMLSAGVFTVWHCVVVNRTIGMTNLQREPAFMTLGLVGAFLAISVGGALFAWLRIATHHLAGSVIAHWAFNALLLLGLGTVAT